MEQTTQQVVTVTEIIEEAMRFADYRTVGAVARYMERLIVARTEDSVAKFIEAARANEVQTTTTPNVAQPLKSVKFNKNGTVRKKPGPKATKHPKHFPKYNTLN